MKIKIQNKLFSNTAPFLLWMQVTTSLTFEALAQLVVPTTIEIGLEQAPFVVFVYFFFLI